MIYVDALRRYLQNNAAFSRIRVDLTQWGGPRFWSLGDRLHFPPPLRFKRGKRRHRWGFLILLFKRKLFREIAARLVTTWSQVRWRPDIGYHQHCFATWYTLNGRTLSLLAGAGFPDGDATSSVAALQTRVLRFQRHRDPDPHV